MTSPREPSQTSQRVRVGMIGLAAVVLLIAMAGAILGPASRDRDAVTGTAGAATQGNLVLANQEQASEPLSDLGVVPSAGNDQAPQP